MALHQETPAVLLIHWRRQRFLLPQVNALREAGVRQFYIACDGPRGSDDEAVLATQDAIVNLAKTLTLEGLEVKTRISTENFGCEKGVLNAIDWFFGHVSEGIILEDDCFPGVDFVPFVYELLERYRGNKSVFSVSGENSTAIGFKDSYGFVAHPFIWGWATWKDRWTDYNEEHRKLSSWNSIRDDADAIKRLFPNSLMRAVWTKRLDRLLFDSFPDTWDYQLTYFVRHSDRLCVVPSANLVINLGEDFDGTHIVNPTSRTGQEIGQVLPMCHPKSVLRSVHHEYLFFWRDEGRRRAKKMLRRPHQSPRALLVSLNAFGAAFGAAIVSNALQLCQKFKAKGCRTELHHLGSEVRGATDL